MTALETADVVNKNFGGLINRFINGMLKKYESTRFKTIMVVWKRKDKGKSENKDKIYVYHKQNDIKKCLQILKGPRNLPRTEQTKTENKITNLKSYWFSKGKITPVNERIKKNAMLNQHVYDREPLCISFETVKYHYKYQMYFFSFRSKDQVDVSSLLKNFDHAYLKKRSKMPGLVKKEIRSKVKLVVYENNL